MPEVLAELAQHGRRPYVRWVATNPAASEVTLVASHATKRGSVRAAVASRHFPAVVQVELAAGAYPGVRVRLAQAPDLPLEARILLAADPHLSVREYVRQLGIASA